MYPLGTDRLFPACRHAVWHLPEGQGKGSGRRCIVKIHWSENFQRAQNKGASAAQGGGPGTWHAQDHQTWSSVFPDTHCVTRQPWHFWCYLFLVAGQNNILVLRRAGGWPGGCCYSGRDHLYHIGESDPFSLIYRIFQHCEDPLLKRRVPSIFCSGFFHTYHHAFIILAWCFHTDFAAQSSRVSIKREAMRQSLPDFCYMASVLSPFVAIVFRRKRGHESIRFFYGHVPSLFVASTFLPFRADAHQF